MISFHRISVCHCGNIICDDPLFCTYFKKLFLVRWQQVFIFSEGGIQTFDTLFSRMHFTYYRVMFVKLLEKCVNYSCVGLGTPGPENDSADGKITLNFQKDTDYAFFVDGELIYNILSYRDETLIINGQ